VAFRAKVKAGIRLCYRALTIMAVKIGVNISDRAGQCSDWFREKEFENRNVK
jgi:P2-related tail formation protein